MNCAAASRRPRAASQFDSSGGDHPPDPGPDPTESVWREDRRAVVREAVEALPSPQREALSLAFLEDLTNEQVADFLDLPLGTTKSRIRSGLRALRGSLAPLVAAGLISGRTLHRRRYARVRSPDRPDTPGPRPRLGHQQRGRAATPGSGAGDQRGRPR